ncbi:MAG: anti-sigma factor [Nitrospinota bacterium]|nr:MAG: anti-sigma factor [Nitrospinota bacterium]
MMNCEECQRYLHPYLDAETALPETLAIQAHLDACPRCRRQWEVERALRRLMREELDREPDLPPTLWPKIQRALRRQESRQKPRPTPWWSFLLRRHPAYRIVAGVIVLILIPVIFFLHYTTSVNSLALALADHQAMVQGKSLPQVMATEQEEVVRWLRQRLPFAPPVPAFERVGLRLQGGNLCKIRGVAGATLLYEQGGHWISYYVFPANAEETIPAEERHTPKQRRYYLWRAGAYRVVFWREGNLICALISDLSEARMVQMVEALLDQQVS